MLRHRSMRLIYLAISASIAAVGSVCVDAYVSDEGVRLIGCVAMVLTGFFLYVHSGRSRVDVDPSGITIRNFSDVTTLAWDEIVAFCLEPDPAHRSRPPRAYVVLTDGRKVGLVALEGTHVHTRSFTDWSRRSIVTLNGMLATPASRPSS